MPSINVPSPALRTKFSELVQNRSPRLLVMCTYLSRTLRSLRPHGALPLLLSGCFAASAVAAPFTNGSFESPGSASGNEVSLTGKPSHVTGWVATVTNNGMFYEGVGNTHGWGAHQGHFGVSFGHLGDTTSRLHQTFDTVAGATYTVRYYVSRIQGGGATQSLAAEAFDGTSSALLAQVATTIPSANNTWAAGTTLTFTATSASTRLQFRDTSPSAGDANWALDNVTVSSSGADAATFLSNRANLLANDAAEADASASGDGTDHDVVGWESETGQFTVIRYTTGGGYPAGSSPGPQNRGRFFFAGGNGPSSSAAQVVDISGAAARIDAGTQAFNLSGYLGGYSNQDDHAQVTATFKDATNTAIGTASIGPVTAADRSNATGLLSRFTNGIVPIGTRSVEVVVLFTRILEASNAPSNDGYADNISFRLLPDEFNARDEFAVTQGGANGLWQYGYSASDTDHSFTQFTYSDILVACNNTGLLERWLIPNGDQIPQITRVACPDANKATLFIHPGYNGSRAVVRWTAPTSGTFQVTGALQKENPSATTDVKILKNITQPALFSGSIGGNTQQPFDFTVTVAAGDTLDFSVGNGNGSQISDGSFIAISIAQPVTGCEDAPANQQVFIPADNSPSDVLSGNNGVLAGGATYAAGVVGRSLELNGSGSYAILPNNAAQRPANQLTVEGWFRYDALNNFPHLVSKPLRDSPFNSYALWYDGSIRVGYQPVGQSFTYYGTGYQPQLGVWNHYAMVINTDDSGTDANTIKLYVNGVEVFSGPASSPIYYNGVHDSAVPYPLLIGADYESNSPSYFLDGGADEVSIYGRALTHEEIFDIVQQGSYGHCLPENSCVQAPGGLVSLFKGNGNALDSASSNHGTLQNGATFAAGKVGEAFSFNGSNQYVLVGDPVPASLQIQNEISLDAWIYVTSYPSDSPNGLGLIIGSQYDPQMAGATIFLDGRTNPDGQTAPPGHIHFQIGDGSWHVTNTNSQVPLNQWVHVAATRKANENAKIYFNGVLQPSTSMPWSGSISYNGAWFAIGQQKGINRPFNGLIDEAKVFNRALTAAEVQAIYNAGSSGLCALPAASAPANQNLWFTGDGTPASFVGTATATLHGNANYVAGRVGQAFNFPSSGAYLSVPDAPEQRPTSQLTIEGWFKMNSLGATNLISKPFTNSVYNSYVLFIEGNRIQAGYGTNSTFVRNDTGVVPRLGEWYHLAYTINPAANTHTVYINGQAYQQNSAQALTYEASPQPLLIGAEFEGTSSPSNFLNGQADEVSLYSSALSASQIQAIYYAGLAGKAKQKPTAAGSNVVTQLSDATVSFASVTAAGTTSQQGVDLGSLPALPAEAVFTGLAYDLSTTATYQTSANSVGVCFNVPGLASWTFSKLRILHLENGAWVDRTNRSSTAPTLCTSGASSLSPFAIVYVEPPFDGIDDPTTAEDTPLSIPFTITNPTGVTSVTATSSDPAIVPNDVAHLSITGSGASRTLHVAPAQDQHGVASITISVNRSSGAQSDSFTLTITDVNDAPVVTADQLSTVVEDSGPRTIPTSSLLANDAAGPANENAQAIAFVGVSNPVGGSVSVSGSDVIFTPAANYNGVAGFTYTVEDNGTTNGADDFRTSVPGSVTFNVSEVNEAPVAANDSLTAIAEDSGQRSIPFSALTGNDSTGPAYEGSESLVVASVGDAVGGTVSISGGNVIFTPAQDFNGAAGFSYTVQDNGTTNGASDPLTSGPATVSFTVTEVNDAPIASDDSLGSIAEDSGQRTIAFADLLANDARGPANESSQTITVVSVSGAVNGTVSISGTDVIFTPDENFNGTAGFTYTIQDNGTTNSVNDFLTSPAASVTFTVTEVNDAPVATADSLSEIAEDSGDRVIAFTDLLGNDSTGPANESTQTLVVSSVTDAVGGTVAINGTDVVFTPELHFNGAASFAYTAKDDGTTAGAADPKTSAPVTVSFTITEVNDKPTAANDTLTSIAEDSGPRTIPLSDLTANDSVGPTNEGSDSVVVNAIDNAVGGTIALNGNNVIFTPDEHFNGTASFTYTVQDAGTTHGDPDALTSAPATVSFTITEVNDPSVANNDTLGDVAEDSTARAIAFSTLLANDSRGPANESNQTLTVNAVDNAVGGTVAISGTDVIFTPAANYYGPASFAYTARDNGTTNGVDAPYTSALATVSFTITEVNDAPVANDDTLSAVAEDSAARTIPFSALLGNDSLGASNENDQSLTVSSVSSAVGGTVAIVGSNVIFTPAADFNGTAGFLYTATDNGTTGGSSDPRSHSSPASVSFTITEVNDAPSAAGDSLSAVAEDSSQRSIAIADLLANDVTGPSNESGQTLAVTSVGDAVGGSVAISGSNILFTPDADFNGTASFTYVAQDNGTTNSAGDPLSSAPATVSFTVTAVNDAPSAANDSLTAMLEDAGVRSIAFSDLTANDSRGPTNENAQTLTVSSVGDAVGGVVSISNGSVLFTPAADFNGIASFSYLVQDNGTTNGSNDFLTSAPATASFAVTPVNDAPIFALAASPAAINEDAGAQAIDNFAGSFQPGPATATDEASQTLVGYNVSVTEVTGSLAFSSAPTINNAGQLAYTVAPNTSGTATISVTATDSGSGTSPNVNTSAPQTFTITVNPVNDAPSFTNGASHNVNGEAGAQSLPVWVTGISAGPADEAAQTLTFLVTNDNNALFTSQPTIAPNGTLTYTPANTMAGTATVSVALKDNGGTANGGQDTSAVQTFTITVVDTTPPVISNTPSDMIVEATSASGATVNYTAPTASDRVSGDVTVTCSPTSGSAFALGNTTVTCSATDTAGNTASSTFKVLVRDTTAPAITGVPANITAEATGPSGAAVTFTNPTAQDAVTPNVPVTCTPASGATFALGATTVTCSASDEAGNASTATFTVTVQDTTAPTLSNTPANITAEATSAEGAAVTYTNPTATDAVDAEPTITCAPASGATFALGATTVTCTAQDDAGNSSTSTFTITVQDTTAPSITAPDEVVAEATAADGATVTFTTSAIDLVTPNVQVTCTPASGTKFALGSTPVTCSASDAAGNTATDSFNVIVRDTSGPVFTNVPADITIEATSATGATVTYTAPTASDVVSGDATVSCAPASGSTFALGTTVVTCSAKDAADNTGTATFNVVVRDTTAPTFSNVPAEITTEASGPSGATVTYTAPTAQDIVSANLTVTCTPASGSEFALGTTAVTCSATDEAGNAATASFNVKVVDSKAPSIDKPADITAEATGPTGAVVSYPTPKITDSVDANASTNCTPASGSTFALGNTVVTCTATDSSGNQATATFTVTVRDTTAPTISAPADMVVYNDKGQEGAVVTFTVTATDLVDGSVNPTLSHASGSFFPLGTTSVTATVIDAAGNQAAPKTFKVTVRLSEMANISTRAPVGTGENVLIGGFIIDGTEPRRVVVRAIGPSMRVGDSPLAGALQDPTLELFAPDGTTVFNDNWIDSQAVELTDTGLAPTDPREAAILATLAPGAYTAVIRGAGDSTGLAVVEAYALADTSASLLANISTRGTVGQGDAVLIGGLIVQGNDPATVVVRAIGPSLTEHGVVGALADPSLEVRDANGDLLAGNNDWRETQQTLIEGTGLAPTDQRESVVVGTLPAGNYTAIVYGNNGTAGVALVEIYNLR